MSKDEDSNDEKELSEPATSQPVETSTSTTSATQPKKKRSTGMKVLISFCLVAFVISPLIRIVNPHWAEESNETRQRIVDQQWGSAQYADGTKLYDAKKMFPKKETTTQAILSTIIAFLGVYGIYRFVWKD